MLNRKIKVLDSSIEKHKLHTLNAVWTEMALVGSASSDSLPFFPVFIRCKIFNFGFKMLWNISCVF